MKKYTGERTIDGIRVEVDGQKLDEHYDIKRFSQSGFEWTYDGDAPRQLALALLFDHLGNADKALSLCERFMNSVVGVLDNDWSMSSEDLDKAIVQLEKG